MRIVRSEERPDGRMAGKKARNFCAEHKLADPTIYEIEAIAMFAEIVVRYAPLSGVDAMLMQNGEVAHITVAQHLPICERRFCVAHEIGHWIMHRGISRLPLCLGEHALATYLGSPQEREGDIFARELLMRRKLVRARFDCNAPSWELVEKIAYAFQVSLIAAALRVIELSDLEIALVRSRNNVVEWSRPSFRFQKNLGRVERGHVVDWASGAFDAKPDRSYGPRESWLDAWVPSAPPRIPLVEASLGASGGAFTLVWAPIRERDFEQEDGKTGRI